MNMIDEEFKMSQEIQNALIPDKDVERVVFTVGSVLRGDDAAGPYIAKMIENEGLEGWKLVQGDLTPEDDLGYLRLLHPKFLVLIDAADMGLEPGEIRRVEEKDVKKQFLITTHSMPITFLLSSLQECCDQLIFLGIQPAQTEFYGSMTDSVKSSCKKIYEELVAGSDFSDIPWLS